jgi:hypothetical protein
MRQTTGERIDQPIDGARRHRREERQDADDADRRVRRQAPS